MSKQVIKLLRDNAVIYNQEVLNNRKVEELLEEQKQLTEQDDDYYRINAQLHQIKLEMDKIAKKSDKLYMKLCPLAKDFTHDEWTAMIDVVEKDYPNIGLGDVLVRSNFA